MPSHNTLPQTKSLEVWLRSTVFQLALIVVTFVVGPLIMLLYPLPFRYRYQMAQLWVGIILWATKHVCGIDYVIEGLENIPKDGNGVILCKHQSSWETIALQKIFPPQVFLLKKSLLWLPVWGWAMAALRPIAIDRSNQKAALRSLLEQGTQCLQDGLWVVVFPEGTRVAPGTSKKFNAGGAMLAQRAGYPIVPVAHNAGEFWPRYSFFKYPGTIQVRIGPAIYPGERKPQEVNQEVETWMRQVMGEIEHTSAGEA